MYSGMSYRGSSSSSPVQPWASYPSSLSLCPHLKKKKKRNSHRAIVRVPQNRASRHLAKCAQHRLAAWHGWDFDLDLITKPTFFPLFHNAPVQSFLAHSHLHTKAGCSEQWVPRD